MPQPQWITPAGSLGTIPEGIFYRVSLQATAEDQQVFFRLISGQPPAGIQITENGLVEGTPKNLVNVQGVPREVGEDTTSRFAIRAFTKRLVNGQLVVDRLADRTFTLTVTGQDIPEFLTPSGSLGAFFDGTQAVIPILFSDPDPDDQVTVRVVSGSLPPGLVLDPKTGVISGLIIPLTGPPGTAQAGYDATQYDEFPYDFSTRSASKNFQFTIGITDGKEINLRTFTISVISRDSMTADDTEFTADNTVITADVSPVRVPILLTPAGNLGRVRSDNFYAFKFDAIDFDGDPIEYSITTGPGLGYDATPYDSAGFDRGAFRLPPDLELDPNTGWLYGLLADEGLTEITYRFAIRVAKANNPSVISDFYYFTITVVGNIDTDVIWITDPDLGVINNGSISTLAVRAVNTGGEILNYRLAKDTANRLPQGLTLLPSGDIVGRVSFNTFALDGGTTTFDEEINPRLGLGATTFDLKFEFTVNAFAEDSEALGFEVQQITVTNGGSGYDPNDPPTVTISAPPFSVNSIQATAGAITIVDGVITNIAVGNPGRGYLTVPSVTIVGPGGATATASIQVATVDYSISVFRRFSITVNRAFNEPYETLYIKAMPPLEDRALISTLLDSESPTALIPTASLYRPDDPNFGITTSIIYDHAYGLTAAATEAYVQAMDINHYWKNLTLGPIRTAQALDAKGNILYEVIYSEIIDDLVNNQGQSVGKSVIWPYLIDVDGETIDRVYPNSLINMRDQIIDSVGQISPALPLWMTSKQANGQVLGFTPAWVIAYVRPGESGRIVYNIQQNLSFDLNAIDYEVDRYELDRSQTRNWNPADDSWIPSPPESTTFDLNTQRLYTVPVLNIPGRSVGLSNQFGFGTQTQFTVEPAVISPFVLVRLNGQPQQPARLVGSTVTGDFRFSYAFNSITINFVTAPPSSVTTATGDGSTVEFAYTPISNRGLSVTVDGETQTLGTDYTVASGRVIFSQAPDPLSTVNIIQPSTITILQITDIYVNNPNSPYGTETTFDQRGTGFNSPADRWIATDEFDKYLVFPKRTIIG
jgi:hypothetical protein